MTYKEFRKRLEEYWAWAGRGDRLESSWWLSVKDFASYEYERAYERDNHS